MLSFKSFQSASATLEGIEVTQMIRKDQFDLKGAGSSSLQHLRDNCIKLRDTVSVSEYLRQNRYASTKSTGKPVCGHSGVFLPAFLACSLFKGVFPAPATKGAALNSTAAALRHGRGRSE